MLTREEEERNQRILALFDAEQKKIDAMPPKERKAYCIASLIRQGILAENGKLHPRYGGDGWEEYYGYDATD